jgi:prepilin peptidase CpaA
MQGGYFSYGLLAALAIALLVAAFTDLRRRQIDNWLTGAVALGAPLFWYATGLPLSGIGWQLGIALAAFAVWTALFAIGWMGGGDVKLLTALALWIRPPAFLDLLLVMSLAGCVLTIGFAAWHMLRKQDGKVAVPYGIAISFGGLWVIACQYFPGLNNGTGMG